MADNHLATVADSIAAQLLTDTRALNQRAQETAASIHKIGLENAVALQHQVSLQAAAYAGSHLRRGSEVDSQESVAEGAIYKGESLASLPQTQAQHSSVFNDQVIKSIVDGVTAQVLAKVAQTTPPQSGGHAVQPPANRE